MPEIESRRFWSTAARIASVIAAVFALVFAVLAVMRFAQRFRVRTPAAARPVPTASVLTSCASSLRDVQRDARTSGWSPELARRALPALRIASASALGRPVAQQYVGRDVVEREGQVVVRLGSLNRGRAVVSAAVTAPLVTSLLEGRGSLGARARASLAQLGAALQAFSAAAYGRQGAPLEGSSLDRALEDALEGVKRLRTGELWPMRMAQSVTRTFTGL